MGGLFLLGGLASGLFLLFPVVLVLALLVILALRHDDDADSSRAPAIYGAIIAFVGVLTLLFATVGLATSLLALTADDSGGGGIELPDDDMFSGLEGDFDPRAFDDGGGGDDDDAAITSAVGFIIAGAAALGLLAVHRALFARRHQAVGAARRVHRAYLLVVCLVTALIAMVAGGMALYSLYRTLFADTAGVDNRADELRTLLSLLVLFVGAGAIWQRHWSELELDPAAPPFSAAAAP